jgi:acyl carrier protein
MQENVELRIKSIASKYVNRDGHEIKSTDAFVVDLYFDSLDAVEMIMDVEDEFGIEISDEDAEKIGTVQQAIDYVTAKV